MNDNLVNAHALEVPRTAHYYTIGTASKQTRYFVLACHGYGQAAARFIHKFEAIAREDVFVVAPEGLSRFYWGGFTGDVVASWMTRGNRLDEIADYCNYLQTIYDQYTTKMPADVKIILFGFSQGCATQMRWMLQNQPRFDTLVLWAGSLPDDLDFSEQRDYFNAQQLFWLYGTEDQFIKDQVLEKQYAIMQQFELNFKTSTFEGKHQIYKPALATLFEAIY